MTHRVLTIAQVAEQLQIKESWIRAKCEGREITFSMLGGQYRFTDAHVDEIIRQFEEKPAKVQRGPRAIAPRNVTRLDAKVPPRLRKKQQAS
ncbi:helix-turn-helix domain-containing protein [Nocardiopsis tropica]|uniref:helix-turn-helix domain-containing protein n=1 Tax=Nocardiopsis tropica TaxID=109330 RepID=UPI002E87EBAF|nr:helix-turn-helix domain-containing protein [Nocardiopsis tropica]